MKVKQMMLYMEIETLWGLKNILQGGDTILFIEEIDNMPNYCIFIYQNNTYYGYHTDNFEDIDN